MLRRIFSLKLVLVCGLLTGLLKSSIALATCSEPLLQSPERATAIARSAQAKAQPVVLVTHPSKSFDPRLSSKRGTDELMRVAKVKDWTSFYLKDDDRIGQYFVDDCEPTAWVFSQDGELSFELSARDVYVAGGHLELCLSRSLHDLILQWAKAPPQSHRITFVMDGIYSNGKYFEEGKAGWDDLQKFFAVTNYRRPGGEAWPKLNLLESMGVIKSPVEQLEYLQTVLPRWDRTFDENWRVELIDDDDVVTVLQKGQGFSAPVMQFKFVDSMLDQ
ncbi:MAG: hypothetical protein RLZZ166_690 [Pseudomonadota bacterium]|jgi:hypothetical protein